MLVQPGTYTLDLTYSLRDDEGYEYASFREVFEGLVVDPERPNYISIQTVAPTRETDANVVVNLSDEVNAAEVSLSADSNHAVIIRMVRRRFGAPLSVRMALERGIYKFSGREHFYPSIEFKGFVVNVDGTEQVTELTVPPIRGSVAVKVSDPPDGTQLNGAVTFLHLSEGWEVTLNEPFHNPSFDRQLALPSGRYLVEIPVIVGSARMVIWDVIDLDDSSGEYTFTIRPVDAVGTVKAKLVGPRNDFRLDELEGVAEKVDIADGESVERPLQWVINEFGEFTVTAPVGHHHWVVRYAGQEEHIVADVKSNVVTDLGTIVIGTDPEPPTSGEPPITPPPPTPGEPPAVTPRPPASDYFEISESTLKDHTEPGKPIVIELPANRTIFIDPQVKDLLRERGQDLQLQVENMAFAVRPDLLDLGRWSEVDPELKAYLDRQPEGTVRFAIEVDEVQLADPPSGLRPAGGAFEVRWKVRGSGGEEIVPARWPVPVYFSAPMAWSGEQDIVAVWRISPEGTKTARPSWASDDRVRFTAQHPGTYVIAALEAGFRDMAGHWAEDIIEAAYAHGIVQGTDPWNTRFAPDRPITRLEFVAMLSRALGLDPDPDAAEGFRDARHTWAAGWVGAAYRAGVTHGLRPGYFGANEQLTRLQLAVMLGRALETKGVSLPVDPQQVLARFQDRASVPAWARRSLATAVLAGVVRGDGQGFLHPDDLATRAETGVMAVRFLRAWFESVGPLPEQD
ncbi:hypothetical protein JCM13210_10120 [Thermaerobacter litoralis]